MRLNELPEIRMVGVFERAVPNQERIVLQIMQAGLNLGQFGIMLGVRTAPGWAVPIRDNLFWFGDAQFNTGDWIFVYTGPGQPRVTQIPNDQGQLYTVHWNRKVTVFDSPEIVPILFRTDAVHVLQEQLSLPAQS
jgi:hypothetical protein